jgi:hypothetical protein
VGYSAGQGSDGFKLLGFQLFGFEKMSFRNVVGRLNGRDDVACFIPVGKGLSAMMFPQCRNVHKKASDWLSLLFNYFHIPCREDGPFQFSFFSGRYT